MNFRPLFRSVVWITLALAGLVSALPTFAIPEGDTKAGKVLADNGFRPKPGGFGFENWGADQYPQSDLTAEDAVSLFGDRVCARFEGQTCIPTPSAKLWIKEMNQMMKGGHCEGMAALSAAFHVKTEKVDSYGATVPFALKPKDAELMRTISTYFVTQALEPVQSVTAKTRKWTLQAIVDFLIRTISTGQDYPTLGIYGAEGGHAITPYMVVLRGEGTYRIFVYDNNYPGVENFVDIDVKRNRWVYAGAALNPSEPPSPWEGGAGAMDITLLSDRYQPLQCPFCGSHKPPKRPPTPARPQEIRRPEQRPRPSRKPSISSNDYAVFTPNRCSQLQATRKKDKKVVRMGKAGVESQVESASMLPLRGARGCYIRLPSGTEYDLALVDDGRPVYRPLTELVVFAPGSVYSITNISVEISISQSFSFSQSGFNYQAGGRQRPTLRVAGDAAGTNGYYEVSGFELSAGSSFSAERQSDGQMAFQGDGVDSFDIYAESVGETETETFDFDGVEVGDDGQALLDIEADGDIELDIDSDSDGQANDEDLDDDNDGSADGADLDDDGDGTADTAEPADFDEDGIADAEDLDDDNDGDLDAEDEDDSTEDVEEEDGEEEVEGDEDEDDSEEGDDDEADDEADDESEETDDEADESDEADDDEVEEDTEDSEADEADEDSEADEDEEADDDEGSDEGEAEEEDLGDEGDDDDDSGDADEAEEDEAGDEGEDEEGDEEAEGDDGGDDAGDDGGDDGMKPRAMA